MAEIKAIMPAAHGHAPQGGNGHGDNHPTHPTSPAPGLAATGG